MGMLQQRAIELAHRAPSTRDRARSVRALCNKTDPTIVYHAMHCLGSLFGTLFMSNVHRLLFQKKKKGVTLGFGLLHLVLTSLHKF